MTRVAILIIHLYQNISHTLFPRTCRFYPSCSQYAVDALRKHGLWKGAARAFLRLVKCSPLFKGGYDPA